MGYGVMLAELSTLACLSETKCIMLRDHDIQGNILPYKLRGYGEWLSSSMLSSSSADPDAFVVCVPSLDLFVGI
jgi:hypothetical protein